MNKSLAQFKMDKVQMNKLSGGIVCTFFDQSDPTGTFSKEVTVPDGMDYEQCQEKLQESYRALGYKVMCL